MLSSDGLTNMLTQEQIEKKKKAKKATETVKRARGGRTIEF